jgi:acyl-CoA synthetase (AMP-forming)/AMP-acid ligase II
MRVALTTADFLARAALHGPRPAIVDAPGTAGTLGRMSYEELAGRARGLALGLDRLGIRPGERVAVVSANSARLLIALFGVTAFGRILVPINYRLNAQEIDYIVEHSGAALLLVDPDLDEALAGVAAGRRLRLDGCEDVGLFAVSEEEPAPWEGDEDATATLCYTSGTTARPKGVELTHRNLWLNAVAIGWHVGVCERDAYLHTVPLFHCNGWGLPYALAAMGARQVLLRRVDGAEILRLVAAEGITMLAGAPATLAAIVDAAEGRRGDGGEPVARGGVRMLLAGAPPAPRLIERAERELGWEVIHGYGLTETSPLLTVNRAPAEWDGLDPGERARRLSRQGVPALGVRLRVDEEGEVLARSNHVFARYWRQPRETERAIGEGWLRTGDGGRLEGAYLRLTDRKKDVIVSGGENVSSIEVEGCLQGHPDVAEAAVIGVPHPRWGETVKALVVLREGAASGEQELIAFCRARMAHYKCPTSVELRDALPRTVTGKLQKFRLREPYWQGLERAIS